MNIPCDDRDRIFEHGAPAEWAALEAHAATCASCAEELRAWKSLSTAAAELRDYTESPSLWPRIHRALADQAARETNRGIRWNWRWLLPGVSLWQAASLAAAALLLVATPLAWRYVQPLVSRYVQPRNPVQPAPADLLRKKALTDVERAESVYVQAIDKLALQAKPQLDKADTPLMANYREKLQVLDSAIDDLRMQTGQNPSNAHLRYQLLAMYQEKQRTLEEILEEKR